MTAAELLATLRTRGVTLTAAGGKLKVRPASALDEGTLELLKQHKAELLALLEPRHEPPAKSLPATGPSEDVPHLLHPTAEGCARARRQAARGIIVPGHDADSVSVSADDDDTIPRLPWQLERLLRAASSNVLEVNIKGVPDPARYVMAWGCAYLTGEREESVQRLWQVYRAWNNEVN